MRDRNNISKTDKLSRSFSFENLKVLQQRYSTFLHHKIKIPKIQGRPGKVFGGVNSGHFGGQFGHFSGRRRHNLSCL